MSKIVSEIAAPNKEQQTGIEEVNQAVKRMDNMIQQNAALVEQTASASMAINQETGKLTELINFFSDVNQENGSEQNSRVTQLVSNQ